MICIHRLRFLRMLKWCRDIKGQDFLLKYNLKDGDFIINSFSLASEYD
jgi:hypothetical protein